MYGQPKRWPVCTVESIYMTFFERQNHSDSERQQGAVRATGGGGHAERAARDNADVLYSLRAAIHMHMAELTGLAPKHQQLYHAVHLGS